MLPGRLPIIESLHAAESPVSVLIFKDVAAGVQSLATAGALLVGGVWAYYKFFRSRTFRPRLEGDVTADLVHSGNALLADLTVTLKNVGLTRLDIVQEGSGLRLHAYDGEEPDFLYEDVAWEHVKTLTVFRHHQWIEPSESIRERMLLHVGQTTATAYKFDLRLVAGTNRSTAPAHRFEAIRLVDDTRPAGGATGISSGGGDTEPPPLERMPDEGGGRS